MRKFRRKQLKEDKFVESVVATRLFFSRHSKLLVFVGLVVAAIIASMTLIASYRKRMDRKASALFQQARTADAYLELYHGYARSTIAPMALYEAAKLLYGNGRYDESGENFRLFLRDFPEHPLAPEALNSVGYCLEVEGKLLQAAEVYRDVAREYEGSFIVPSALINGARCYRYAGKQGEAIGLYERVISDFPGSLRHVDAERYLAELKSSAEKPEELDSAEGEG